MAEVRDAAPAKINLFLRILAREASGYHALETLFCAISLADEVVVREAGSGIRLRVEGTVDAGPPERNLALRAAERYYAEVGTPAGVEIVLHKRIPAAAGMGGGSSDAAAVLRALNTLHRHRLPAQRLLQLGSELGSDVPFFLCGSTLALAWGRGERLLALPPLPPRPVLIVHPGTAIATAEAFRRLADSRAADTRVPASTLDLASLASWPRVADSAFNDFEPVADALVPELPDLRRRLCELGAGIAMLAGSGSCVFGIFAADEARDRAGAELRQRGAEVWAARTLEEAPASQVDPDPPIG